MKSNFKNLFTLCVFFIVLISTYNLILSDQPLSQLLLIIKEVNLFYIILSLIMINLFLFCDAIKLKFLLSRLNQKTTLLKTWGYSFIGFYFSSITPSATGGQPAQIFYMHRDNIHISYATLSLLITTITYQIVSIFYGLIMYVFNFTFFTAYLDEVNTLIFISTCINGFVIFLSLLAMFSQTFLSRLAEVLVGFLFTLKIVRNKAMLLQKVDRTLIEYSQGATYIRQNPKLIAFILLVTCLQLTALYAIPFFIYRSFNLTAHSPLQIIGAQAIISLAVSSIPLPGGMGVSENSFLQLFRLFFDSETIVLAMLLSRFTSFYIILIVSAFITLFIHLTYIRKRRKLKRT